MIRHAEHKDRNRVVLCLKRFYEASGLFESDIAYAVRLFDVHMLPSTLCMVLDNNGIHGVLMARIVPFELGPGKIARETVWWVDPEYRGYESIRMLSNYETWAKANGCDRVHMVSIGNAKTDTLYARRGYEPVETHYWKKI